ncbi:hypothetical protein N9Z72_00070 [Akkermansiaceae bacterium]|nr:hypothetical protein [Akkermansiaceae bacterium]
MKYEQQLNTAMARLDESLTRLRDMIKRNQNQAAIQYMENGDLKEKYEELQNIITIASTGNYGVRGVNNTGHL